MQRALSWIAIIVLFSLGPVTAARAELTLQAGDRWPQAAAHAVVSSGGYLYLGRGNVLTVLGADLSSAASTTLDGEVQGIYYAGGYVYAAMGDDGLQVVDVSDPAAPAALSIAYQPDTGVDGVFIAGSTAYAVGLNGLETVDVADPATPSQLGAATLPGVLVYATNIYVASNLAAVADQVNGLQLVDLSDAATPVWQSVTAIAGAWDVAVSGDYAYLTAGSSGLNIVNLQDPASPVTSGQYAPDDSNFMGLALAGGYAYIADEENGLRQVDLSDPASPASVQIYAGTGGAYSVATNGTDLWVADFTQGLQQIGGGVYDTPADTRDLFVDEDYYLFAVDDGAGSDGAGEGLRILDVLNVGDFVFKGFAVTPGEASGVCAAGDYAYVADGSAGLQIIDIAARSDSGIFTPQIVGTLDTGGTALDVVVSGDYAYVADGAGGLRIINVADPAGPYETGAFDTPGTAYAVALSGSYAYVADGDQGLRIVDVTDPGAPSLAGFIALPGEARDVVVSGDDAYVAAGSGGLQIVDVTVAASAVITGSYTGITAATGVSVVTGYVRVADGVAGLVTLDVADPAAPSPVTAWSTTTTGTALKVVSVGDYAFVAEDRAGTAVYKLSDETPFTPEPFNPPGTSGSCFIDLLTATR